MIEAPCSDNAALMESLKTLPYSQLRELLTNAVQVLAGGAAQEQRLQRKLSDAISLVGKRGAEVLIANHGEMRADYQLKKLHEAVEAARAEIGNHRERDSATRGLVKAVQAELNSRDAARERQVRACVEANWRGKSKERIEAARRAIAEAILARECGDSTQPPELTDVGMFSANVIGHGEAHKLMCQLVDAERAAYREEIKKNNPHLG